MFGRRPAPAWLLAGALLYLAGAILVTLTPNVPLNDALAAADPNAADAAQLWAESLRGWDRLEPCTWDSFAGGDGRFHRGAAGGARLRSGRLPSLVHRHLSASMHIWRY